MPKGLGMSRIPWKEAMLEGVLSNGTRYKAKCWYWAKDVNVRLDYGFGKGGQSGFIFNINEAF